MRIVKNDTLISSEISSEFGNLVTEQDFIRYWKSGDVITVEELNGNNWAVTSQFIDDPKFYGVA